ncbi:hypothetical protein JCM19992_28290 [Thermostilla marina]
MTVEAEFAAPVRPFDAQLIHIYRSGYAETVEPVSASSTTTTVVWPEFRKPYPEASTHGETANESLPNRWFNETYLATPAERRVRWHIRHRWIKRLYLAVAPDAPPLHRVAIQIGDASRGLDVDPSSAMPVSQHGALSCPPDRASLALPPDYLLYPLIPLPASAEAGRRPSDIVNIPAPTHVAAAWPVRVIIHPAVWMWCIFAWLVWSFAEKSGMAFAPMGDSHVTTRLEPTRRIGWGWGLAGFVAVAGTFAWQEYRSPLFFLEDDNFAIFLPAMLEGSRCLQHGALPMWTPRQFLGMPLVETGVFALTYPGTIASYFVADKLLGQPTALIDVFCVLHLAAGYAAMFVLLRAQQIRPSVSAAGAVCWSLSGFALVAGRSWYYMTPVFLYVPLIFWCCERLLEETPDDAPRPRRRFVFIGGIALGLFFHAGNAQMWLFTCQMLFIWLAAAWWCKRLRRDCWLAFVQLLLIAGTIAAPLLIAQLEVVRHASRPGGPTEGILDGLFQLFVPFQPVPSSIAPYHGPSDWADPHDGTLVRFYFAGGVFHWAWLLGLAMFVARFVRRKAATPIAYDLDAATVTWLLSGLVALWLSLGSEAGLWTLQSRLPLFSGVYHPMKYLPLVHLFAITSGALTVEVFARRLPKTVGRQFTRAVVAGAVGVSVWHAGTLTGSFYSYSEKAYPSAETLPPVLRSRDVRIFPIAPDRSPAPKYTLSLTHNFACVAAVESAFGYAGFVRHGPEYRRFMNAFEADPIGTLQRYGVTHIVLHRTAVLPVRSGAAAARATETESFFTHPKLRAWLCASSPVYADDVIAVYALPASKPRAESRRGDGVRITWACEPVSNGLVLRPRDDSSGSEWLYVRYLFRPSMQAVCGDKPLFCEPDRAGMIRVRLPDDYAGDPIRVCYRTRWLPGLVLSGLSAIATVGTFVLPRVRRRKRLVRPC